MSEIAASGHEQQQGVYQCVSVDSQAVSAGGSVGFLLFDDAQLGPRH